MNRKDFINCSGALMLGLPFQTLLNSCSEDTINFKGSVIIIGAGAAGLTAGYLLKQYGIDFKILEASTSYGGRMKISKDFADFPIPLGAEWLHTTPTIFQKIAKNSKVKIGIQTQGYKKSDSYGIWKNGILTNDTLGNYKDKKFINSSWFDFFEEYIVPSISENIYYNLEVKSIDYSSEMMNVKTSDNNFQADKLIFTVPLQILKKNIIIFNPPLSEKKLSAIEKATVWDGIKVFMEFKKKFYPTFVEIQDFSPELGNVNYYDASYGQNTEKHILGLFAVGVPALNYISKSNGDLINYILKELDLIFDNQATPNYLKKQVVQNWTEEPFIEGAYLSDYEDWKVVQQLSFPVVDKIYFAGEAYTSGEDWGGVHDAAISAIDAVNQIIKSKS